VRKHLLEYDDVMNKQREAIYQLRRDILEGNEGRDYLEKISGDVIDYMLETHCSEKLDPLDWDLSEISTDVLAYFDIPTAGLDVQLDQLGLEELRDAIQAAVRGKYDEKVERLGAELMSLMERDVMLRVVDNSWKDHLLALDHLKEGIGLRGYGQKNPLQEYKRESFELFQAMKERIEDTIIKTLFRIEPANEEELAERRRQRTASSNMRFGPPAQAAAAGPKTVTRSGEKVGRNDPCPCGSGKKFKKCHGGANQAAS
jgi:preprotein translocase subunit SecA